MYSTKSYNHSANKEQRKKLLFYTCLIAIPVLQFLVFYVYINFGSILMAFRSYEVVGDRLQYSYSWQAVCNNFSGAWSSFTGRGDRLLNSTWFFLCKLFIDIPLALISSFYLYKKKHASGFYKVMLFMPQILSSVILAVLYRYTVETVYPAISGNEGLFTNQDTRFIFTVLFNVIMSFGVNVLIYTSAMSAINDSLIESAQLDGCSNIKEFIYIVIPMIYPTIVTLLVVAISYFFVDQYQVYTLFEVAAGNTENVGYFLYRQNLETSVRGDVTKGLLSYPCLAAYGLILTAIILPITLFSRWALNKFGPSGE